MLAILMFWVSVLNWTHESYKLSWDDPVQVSIFYSLIVFILLDIECSEIIPSKSYCILKTLQNMEQSAIVKAVTFWSIPVMFEQLVIRLKLFMSLISSHLKDNDHESTHQEGSIDHFVSWSVTRTVMENPVFLIVLISKQPCKLSTISMNHCQIEWTKVLVEWKISKIIINVEKECVFEVLWRLGVWNPI